MARPSAYLSKPWIRQAVALVRSRRDLASVVGDVSMSVLMVVTDRPGLAGEAVYVRFKAGDLAVVEAGPKARFEKAYADAEFTIWATYETFAEIHAGRLSEKHAILAGRVRLKGSMLRALRLLKVVRELNVMLRSVPAAY